MIEPEYMVSAEDLKALDAMYEERSPSGRPTSWRFLVEEPYVGRIDLRLPVDGGRLGGFTVVVRTTTLDTPALEHARGLAAVGAALLDASDV